MSKNILDLNLLKTPIMQKVIIPALALLIGMALGAALMKNSGCEKFYLDFATKNSSDKQDTAPITLSNARQFFAEYIKNPIYTKAKPDGDSPCLDNESVLHGWSIDYQALNALNQKYQNSISRFSIFLGKNPDNFHTLILVPEDSEGNLMIGDNLMLEYVRPCPPKCKTTVHLYTLDPSTQTAKNTGRQKTYTKSKPGCMSNPFTEPPVLK